MAINKYNKYNVWRRYKTYDSGKTWVAMDDYEAYQTEENAESCGYIPVTYRWVAVEGTMCNTDTHTLYSRTRQQASYDRGQTWDWTEPAVYNYGEVIEENSPQCGYPIYQWVDAVGEYLCGVDSNQYDKYQKEKRQVSTNNGDTWTDTGEERRGKIIEYSSFDCGFVPKWRWEFTSISCGNQVPSDAQSALTRVVESTEYCEKGNKYNRSKIELSTDDGESWAKTDYYETTLLESATTECGYAEQWVTIDGEYVCGDGDSRYTKYHKEKKQVSYDSGITWNDTDETRKGDVIEEMSTDCGYNDSVTVVTYTDGTVKYFDIKGFLMKGDITSFDTIKRVIVGSTVTSIGHQGFEHCSSLESIVIPNGVREIEYDAFQYCSSLTGITLPDSLSLIDDWAFQYCSSLESIVIPTGVREIGQYAFDDSGLKEMTVKATTPPSLGNNALASKGLERIYVPASSVSTYKFAGGWKRYASKIQAIP